jgi:hypothetical protein
MENPKICFFVMSSHFANLDLQDFKSSFKLCISQGLRSFTQTVGCAVSLYLISPQMTGVMLVVVPAVSGRLLGRDSPIFKNYS